MTKHKDFTRRPVYVYDPTNHTAITPCPQKWFWCRIHWWIRFGDGGEKWYEPYPITVNRQSVYCGPGTFYPKPAHNRSYTK